MQEIRWEGKAGENGVNTRKGVGGKLSRLKMLEVLLLGWEMNCKKAS